MIHDLIRGGRNARDDPIAMEKPKLARKSGQTTLSVHNRSELNALAA
jgi:hypothetical protein